MRINIVVMIVQLMAIGNSHLSLSVLVSQQWSLAKSTGKCVRHYSYFFLHYFTLEKITIMGYIFEKTIPVSLWVGTVCYLMHILYHQNYHFTGNSWKISAWNYLFLFIFNWTKTYSLHASDYESRGHGAKCPFNFKMAPLNVLF